MDLTTFIGQLELLGILYGIMGLGYLAWLSSGVFGVAYSQKRTWSWKIFREDLLKLVIWAGGQFLWVIGINLLDWAIMRMGVNSILGVDRSALADSLSVGGLAVMVAKASIGYYSKAFKNYAKFMGERYSDESSLLDDVDPSGIDWAGVKSDVENTFKAIADAITPDHLQTDQQTETDAEPDELELETLAVMFEEVSGQGADTNPLNRILPDGHNDNGKGWQCSKYSWYLATGIVMNYAPHPDYGPVNGNAMVDYLISKLGWAECAKMDGAIFSYNTGVYGHTGVVKDAKNNIVNDANWTPLKVGTHYLNLDAVGARYCCPKSMLVSTTTTEQKAPQTANMAVVEPKPASTPAVSNEPKLIYHKGETVVPLRKVDYDGRKLRQYDDKYYVVQDVSEGCDRVVLGARGQIWAAMKISDIERC